MILAKQAMFIKTESRETKAKESIRESKKEMVRFASPSVEASSRIYRAHHGNEAVCLWPFEAKGAKLFFLDPARPDRRVKMRKKCGIRAYELGLPFLPLPTL